MKSTRSDAALAALFWVPLALAAVWIVLWPPLTVDGPAHLLGARALIENAESWSPLEDSCCGIYCQYYEANWFPTPNLAGTVLLAALVKFGSLHFAETVTLLLASLGTPLALRYALRAVRPESAWLAIAGLPLCTGYLYFYGFWNYCIGIALALVCVGLALRAAPQWRRGPTFGLAAVLTLTWLTHLVPFVAAAIFLAAVVATGPRTRRAWLVPAATLFPGAALSVAYLLHTDSGDSPSWTGPVGRLVGMVSLHTTVTTFSRGEDVLAASIAIVLVALGVRAVRTGLRWNAAAVAALATTALVLLTPTRFGIDFGLIDERLAVFPVLLGVIWLAASPPPARVAIAAGTAIAVASGALVAVRVPELRRYDRLGDEYASARRLLEPGSVLVALRFHMYTPDAGRNAGWDPTRHLASGLAAETGSIDIGHYEAVLDYFPARFRPDADLRHVLDPGLGGLESVPPQVDLDAVLAVLRAPAPAVRGSAGGLAPSPSAVRTGLVGGARFYVLLIGAPDAAGAAATALAATHTALAADFERVGVTSPRGLVEVWRLR